MKRMLPLVLVVALVVACRIPDLKPFSDATAAMATALKLGFERTQVALNSAAATADDNELKEKSTDLNARWKPTRQAVSALVAYSDSLTALAEAGKDGQETMTKLTDSVNELASAVGALPLTGAALGVVKAVGAKIIALQAERDIRKAVVGASDAVDTLTPLLRDNFTDLRAIHGAASRAWESHVQAQSSILTNYYESLVAEETRLQYLLNLMVDYQSAPARLRWRAAEARAKGDEELAKKREAAIPTEQADLLARIKATDSMFDLSNGEDNSAAARIEARQQQLMTLLTAQRKELALLDTKYRQAMVDLNTVREARASADGLLEKGGEAIDAWQKAHRSLLATVQGRQSRPSVAGLLSITTEITSLSSKDGRP